MAPPCPARACRSSSRFFPTGADREPSRAAAADTRLVCSDDDPYCPGGAARHSAGRCDLPVDLLPGTGHLNTEAGFGPWPAVEAWAQGGAKNGVET